MKPVSNKILLVLCICSNFVAFGQNERVARQIQYDPDWQVIYNNNVDFFNRALRQEYSLTTLWSTGQANYLAHLNYGFEDYLRRREESKEAAMRLLKKYPDLNGVGCTSCRSGEYQALGQLDNFIEHLRATNTLDAGMFFRAIDEDVDSGPKCTLQFYACVLVCLVTIEAFPAYLACCGLCLCQYCKNPPKWCGGGK